jgi:hypothetical protein
MDILNSEWLIKMLEKSSAKPQDRLLNLFDILEDWLDAPAVNTQHNAIKINQTNSGALKKFLTTEATKAGAEMPEMLADQLYFMAVAAIQEKLQSSNSQISFSHAKNAARALIAAQCKKEFHIQKSAAYAIAASFLIAVLGLSYSSILNLENGAKTLVASQSALLTNENSEEPAAIANPEQTAALVAQLELMRHGNCQLIEAIQLPESQKAIYINMVVNGRVSTDPKEQVIAMDLIKRTRCNYTPMLMANSKG